METKVKIVMSDMKKLQKQLNKIQQSELQKFIDDCAKQMTAILLSKVIKRTPVGDYTKEIQVTAKRKSKNHNKGDVYTKRVNPSGKKGGTLRRGWTSKTYEEAKSGTQINPKDFAELLTVQHIGNNFIIEVINPVEYASYVEYGHRKANKQGWVQGKFMLTISERELHSIAPKILESNIKKFLGECMK